MPDVPQPLAETPPPRRRLRFSLASLLWMVTVVSLLLTTILMGLKLHRFQREVDKYRSEQGYLTIRDPSKVHAIGIRTHESYAYCWRVYLPPGRKYRLRAAFREIPGTGFPKDCLQNHELPGGESPILAGVKAKPGEPPLGYVECPGGHFFTPLENWAEGSQVGVIPECIGPESTMGFEADRPIVLVRSQYADTTAKTIEFIPSKGYDGIMIWIDPKE